MFRCQGLMSEGLLAITKGFHNFTNLKTINLTFFK